MDSNVKINDDEIDLSRIWARVKCLFLYPFILWFGNIKTTLLFVLLALLLAIGLKYTIPKTYKASFIIRPNDRTEKFHLKIISDIQLLLKQKDYKSISKAIDLSEENTTKLVCLETSHPAIKFGKDSVNCTEIFIETEDNSLFVSFQKSILNYLEANPYFLKISNLQKQLIDLELVQVEKDLMMLDSLKKLQLRNYDRLNIAIGSQVVINDLINPTASYNAANERIAKKMNLLGRKAFLNNFELVKGVVVSERHSWPPRILIMCLILVPISLIVCFIFLNIKSSPGLKKGHS